MKYMLFAFLSFPFVVMGFLWELVAHGFLTGRIYMMQAQGRVQIQIQQVPPQEEESGPTFH